MIRKLTAKVQKIVPNLPPSATAFSNAFVIEPEGQDIVERKGTLYTVFQISSSEEFDTSLISKIVSDVLHDSYYQSENISPVQSLERSIVEVRDRVTKLTNESIRLKEARVNFSILTAALWGNVMYVVCYGNAASYLVREGDVKPVNSNSEGHFSAASGVVRDQDVFVFTTEAFSQKIPPENLLNTSMSVGNLPYDCSALILKVDMDSDFTEDEIVDFGAKEEKEKKEVPDFLDGIKSKLGNIKFSKVQKPERVEKKIPIAVMDIQLRKGFGRKQKISTIAGVAAILLVVSILWTLKTNKQKDLAKQPEEKSTEQVLSTNSATPENPAAADTAADAQYKVQRISPEVFYDLALVESSANPSSIEVKDKLLTVGDQSAKKIYVSEMSTPKFTLSSDTYADGGISAKYLGNTYTLSGDMITKKTSDGEESTWAQNPILTGGKSISIDMAIYVLKDDGMLLKFLKGEKVDFALTGLDKPLSGAVQVLTDYDFDNIYVADAGNKRVVVLNKDGALIAQYINKNADNWNAIKGVAVSSDEKTIYVLSGTRVFEIPVAAAASIDQNDQTP